MEGRQLGQLPHVEQEYVLPFAEHTADSKWQFCMCKSCQTKRWLLDSLPGKKINYATFRLPDEKY